MEPLDTRRGEFFGDPDHSPTFTDTDAANLYVSHDFGGGVTLRNRTRYAIYDKFYRNIFPGLVNDANATNPAGLPAGSYAPGTIVQIQAYESAMRRENLINQTDLNARFSTGGIGICCSPAPNSAARTPTMSATRASSRSPAIASGVQTIFAAVAAPRIDRPDMIWRQVATSGDNHGRLDIAAFYVQDQIELSPQFELVVGLRYEHLVTRVTDRRTIGFPVGQQRDFRVVNDLWSPRAGLIFKPAANASLYASFSRSYLPRGGDQLTCSISPTSRSTRNASPITRSAPSGTSIPPSTSAPPSTSSTAPM